MYNLDWGYWVFGTDHYDIEECPGGAPAWFGYSETAEAGSLGVGVKTAHRLRRLVVVLQP